MWKDDGGSSFTTCDRSGIATALAYLAKTVLISGSWTDGLAQLLVVKWRRTVRPLQGKKMKLSR